MLIKLIKDRPIIKEIIAFIAIAITIVLIILNYQQAKALASKIINTLSPILWSFVLALSFNPIVIWFERRLKKYVFKSKGHDKLIRIIAIVASMLMFSILVTAFLLVLIPELISSIPSIYIGIYDEFLPAVRIRISEMLSDHPDIAREITKRVSELTDGLVSIVPTGDRLLDILAKLIDGIKSFGLGCVMAIYLLYSKERFLAQSKKMAVAILPSTALEKIFGMTIQTGSILKGYVYSTLADSLIVGIICLIFMVLFRFPYAGIISAIIAITNIIPIFGPLIGAIPSSILIFLSNPQKVIWFVLFIIILQAIDGNIIAPKIIGDKIGISSFWTLAAIIVFGSMFGVIGMVVGVPIFAIVLELLKAWAENKLKKQGLETDGEYYLSPASEIIESAKEKAPTK